MNKKIFLFLTLVFSFFIITDVEASEKVGINYDSNEHFNYYYEQKNNTGFYQFLQNHRLDFKSYINSLLTPDAQGVTENFLIYYSKDLEPYLLDGKSFPNNSKYVILALDVNTSTRYISKYKNKYGYGEGDSFLIPLTTSSFLDYTELLFFDSDGDYIVNSRASDLISDISNFSFDIDGTDKDSSSEFTYFISNLFYFENWAITLYGFIEDIIVTDIYFDNNHYIIDDNENYNNFISWFRTFFTSAESYDVTGTQLNYFKENKYYDIDKSLPSLYQIIKIDSNLNLPSGFTSINLKGANNYFFFPKNVDNKLLNRRFYTHLPDYVETDNASIGANIMDLKSGSYGYIGLDPDDTTTKRIYELKLKKPFTLYSVDFTDKLNNYDSSKKYTDFAFVFVNRWSKATPVLHYNPEAYKVCVYDSSSSSSCTYTDPYTGEDVELSSEQLYEIASQVDSSGASVNIFDDPASQREYAKNNSELYEYDENGEIKGFNLMKILKNIAIFLSSFISIITSLFAYFTLFLGALPIEIQSLLYFLLVGTVIIIIYKLIKG